MEMGGVSIFGKYCKEILGGGSDKKFPQRKNQYIQRKIISATKNNFHNEIFNIYNIYNEIYNETFNQKPEKFPQRKNQLYYIKTKYKKPHIKNFHNRIFNFRQDQNKPNKLKPKTNQRNFKPKQNR